MIDVGQHCHMSVHMPRVSPLRARGADRGAQRIALPHRAGRGPIGTALANLGSSVPTPIHAPTYSVPNLIAHDI